MKEYSENSNFVSSPIINEDLFVLMREYIRRFEAILPFMEQNKKMNDCEKNNIEATSERANSELPV